MFALCGSLAAARICELLHPVRTVPSSALATTRSWIRMLPEGKPLRDASRCQTSTPACW